MVSQDEMYRQVRDLDCRNSVTSGQMAYTAPHVVDALATYDGIVKSSNLSEYMNEEVHYADLSSSEVGQVLGSLEDIGVVERWGSSGSAYMVNYSDEELGDLVQVMLDERDRS